MIEQIEHLSDPTAGDLRIACPESVAAGLLGPIIGRVPERYPRVRLFVEPFLISARPLFPQLDNREADLVFIRPSAPLRPSDDYSTEVLFNDRIRLAAGRHGPWARRREIALAELAEAPWITVPDDDIGGRVVREAFRARGLAPPRISVTSYSIHLRHSLADGARFIAAIPESVLRFNRGNLQELPIDLPEPPWPVVMVTAKRRALNPVAGCFVAAAREVARSFAQGARRRGTGARSHA
jgi:DNA-binding transcriptional LysR family regulator